MDLSSYGPYISPRERDVYRSTYFTVFVNHREREGENIQMYGGGLCGTQHSLLGGVKSILAIQVFPLISSPQFIDFLAYMIAGELLGMKVCSSRHVVDFRVVGDGVSHQM